ncbi:hypothetical protein GCK32_022173, partial [Trichostrongylus colubriformis]
MVEMLPDTDVCVLGQPINVCTSEYHTAACAQEVPSQQGDYEREADSSLEEVRSAIFQ